MIGRFLPSFAAGPFKRKRAASAAAPVFTSRFTAAMEPTLEAGGKEGLKARLRAVASSTSVLPYALSLACLAAGAVLFMNKLNFPDKSELSEAIRRGTRVVVDLHDGRIYGRLRPRAANAGHGVASLSVSVGSEDAEKHAGQKKGASAVTVPVPGKRGEHGVYDSGVKKLETEAAPLPAKDHSAKRPAPEHEAASAGKGHEDAKPEASARKDEAISAAESPAHKDEAISSAESSSHKDEAPSSADSPAHKDEAISAAESSPHKDEAISSADSSARKDEERSAAEETKETGAGVGLRMTAAPAVPPPSDGVPMIAVVVKGVGLSSSGTEAAIALPPEFTLGFSPYSPNLQRSMKEAVGKGHEALLNIPMEAKDFNVRDAGPFSLSASLTEDENLGRLGVTLAQDVPLAGVYTDPDERFTTRPDAVAPVLAELRKHGLMLAYGSGYASYSFFQEAARQGFTRAAGADVQLDQVNDPEGVSRKLEEALAVAKRRGFALVMVSPYPATLKQLGEWAAGLKKDGASGKPRAHVVPLSALKQSVEAQIADAATGKGKDDEKKKEPEGKAGANR